MTVIGIIQARMGSSRLPGKTLRRLGQEPMLGVMLRRVADSRSLDRVAVATTDQPADEGIAAYCRQAGVAVFRGSEWDVLDRYYQAARLLKAQTIVRLTADCPLIDPRIIDEVVGVFLGGGYDYVSNAAPLPSSFPDGMDVEVFSWTALEQAWRSATKPSEREHVTFYLWQHPERFRIRRVDRAPDWSRYRLTVDHPEDFEVVEWLMKALGSRAVGASLEEIVGCLEQHPDWIARNAGIARNVGWQTALSRDREQAEE